MGPSLTQSRLQGEPYPCISRQPGQHHHFGGGCCPPQWAPLFPSWFFALPRWVAIHSTQACAPNQPSGPLDIPKVCPFFLCWARCPSAYLCLICLFREFLWFVLAYLCSLNLFKLNSTPVLKFKLNSLLFALTVDQSQLSKLIELTMLIFKL